MKLCSPPREASVSGPKLEIKLVYRFLYRLYIQVKEAAKKVIFLVEVEDRATKKKEIFSFFAASLTWIYSRSKKK